VTVSRTGPERTPPTTRQKNCDAAVSSDFIRHRPALLREAIDTMLAGDIDTGKAILRDYIKATVGFEKLGEAISTPPKGLIRLLVQVASSSVKGNHARSCDRPARGEGPCG
jgi:hypothetical protein